MSDAPASAHRSLQVDENGVDRTLIRASLAETPLECLQALEELLQLAESVNARGKSVSETD
ncbi:MAG: hypothetical protein KF718_33820 [Polyangiaceae bacterium]|nr:hypothetical protein [Polyangiaceae bacterium]